MNSHEEQPGSLPPSLHTEIRRHPSTLTVVSAAVIVSTTLSVALTLGFFYQVPRAMDLEYLNELMAARTDGVREIFYDDLRGVEVRVKGSIEDRSKESAALRDLVDHTNLLIDEREKLFLVTDANRFAIQNISNHLQQIRTEMERIKKAKEFDIDARLLEEIKVLERRIATLEGRYEPIYVNDQQQDVALESIQGDLEGLKHRVTVIEDKMNGGGSTPN